MNKEKCDIDFNSKKFKENVIKATEDSNKAQSELVERAGKLEQLTKAIQLAVPDIMKLKRGCRIKWGDDYKTEGVYISRGNVLWNNFKIIALKDLKDFIIIGRPITLEDCLIAIRKKKLGYAIDDNGEFIHLFKNEEGRLMPCWECKYWKLNKPLHQQEQETINFLHNLIV